MIRLALITGIFAALSGCVAYPAGYGYADPGYAYGPGYVPAYGYGSINVWAGGGGYGSPYYHGRGGYYHGGYGHGYGHGGSHWEGGGGERGGHGGHGGGGHGH
ncbi:hypothetical protein LMG31841_04866 [Paraburkholderia saeva]|uniref:Lipoprotein n=1 Tax=Paraburkholderia saeva TaxID=2777537 RepID=A0A9N8X4C2_9BURK|nr:hypothetical protein LMG31841_04866 [Paraburkholderia saeva]